MTVGNLDELLVEIKASLKPLRDELRKGKHETDKLGRAAKKTSRAFSGMGRTLLRFGALAGVAMAGRAAVKTSMTFEDLRATLKAVTGSVEGMDASFAVIREFTAGTPFELEGVTSGFINFLNAGILPTTDALADFGNVAAAYRKDISQLSQAVFMAMTGEMEMMKQFGIIMRVEGDKFRAESNKQVTYIDRNATAVEEYIRGLGRTRYPTALADRLDTASGAFSNMKDAANEMFNAIGEGGMNSALTDMINRLRSLFEMMTPGAKLLGILIQEGWEKLRETFKASSDDAKGVAAAFGFIVKAADYLIGGLVGLVEAWRSVGVAGDDSLLKLKTIRTILSNIADAVRDVVGWFKNLWANIAGSDFVRSVLGAGEEAFRWVDEGLGGAMSRTGKNLAAGFAEGFDAVREEAADLADDVADVFQPISVRLNLDERLDEIAAKMKAASENAKDANEALREHVKVGETTADAHEEMAEKAKTAADVFDDMRDAISDATQDMTANMIDDLLRGRSALEGFKDFARGIVSQVIATFLNLLVVNRILNSVFSSIPGFQPLPTLPASGGAASGGGIAGRADGGPVSAGIPYVVGERGPELFVPAASGRIEPNGAMGGPAVIVHQTINLSPGVAGTVRAEIDRSLPHILEASKAGVAEAMARGGSFRRVMLGAS